MREANNHLKNAYQLFNTLPQAPDDVESQQLGGLYKTYLVHTARRTLQDKVEAVSLAREIEIKHAAISDDLVHAQSLVALGTALNKVEQRQGTL